MDILPDLLKPNLKVVFCGTAPGKTSARRSAYYAHPRNRFWKILYETRLTQEQIAPDNFRKLLELDIGLTDLCKFTSGNDDQLPVGALNPARLIEAIKSYRPKHLAFTSKYAGKSLVGSKAAYGWQDAIGETKIFILPTTSPRWGEKWWAENKWHWQTFAKAVQTN